MMSRGRRVRPRQRLLFDELLPPDVARALHELGFNTSYVGNGAHGQPPRGSDDATVLRHAMATNQVVVTYNHDMIILCAELGHPVIWLDPRGRQYRHDELVVLAFGGIARWEQGLAAAGGAVCVRVLRTKVETLTLDRAAQLSEQRMRRLAARKRAQRTRREITGQLEAHGT
jgi:predicted nuclease of predicted toxin-antitoxin system